MSWKNQVYSASSVSTTGDKVSVSLTAGNIYVFHSVGHIHIPGSGNTTVVGWFIENGTTKKIIFSCHGHASGTPPTLVSQINGPVTYEAASGDTLKFSVFSINGTFTFHSSITYQEFTP